MLVPSSLMQSMSTFVAQNVGADQEKRARMSMLCGMAIGEVIGIFMFCMALFAGQPLASIFTSDTAYQLKAAEYLRGYALEALVTPVLFSFIGFYNGHNKTFFVMLQGLAQSFIVRLPMAYIMSRMLPDTLLYVGMSAPSATVFGIIINVVYFFYFAKKMTGQKEEWERRLEKL